MGEEQTKDAALKGASRTEEADAARRDPAPGSRAQVREGLAESLRGAGGDPDALPAGWLSALAKDYADALMVPARAESAAHAPDLVSVMIDARDCVRRVWTHRASTPAKREASAAIRRLDEGIEEGLRQRELYGALRLLVAGEPHVCTCGHNGDGSCDGCSEGFEDRCRFEKALRSLVGVGEEAKP